MAAEGIAAKLFSTSGIEKVISLPFNEPKVFYALDLSYKIVDLTTRPHWGLKLGSPSTLLPLK